MLKNSTAKIVGLCGRKCSGKGVIANALAVNYNAKIFSFATALKEMCRFLAHASTVDELNAMKNSGFKIDRPITTEDVGFISKETGIPYEKVLFECNGEEEWTTVRQMLQFIGTDIIRKYNPTWHIDKLVEKIQNCKTEVIVVDDVRFPNERQALEDLGAKCFFIIRPTFRHISNHESETALKWTDFSENNVVINQWSEDKLADDFCEAFSDDFRGVSDNDLFLYAHPYYYDVNVKFGQREEDRDLAMKIIDANYDKRAFQRYGIITYETQDGEETNQFLQKVLGKTRSQESCKERFVVYNPLIVENIKSYGEFFEEI